jgi:hypothetical protein
MGGVSWSEPLPAEVISAAVPDLEGGNVLFLPDLRFEVEAQEALLFTPSLLGSAKNASYDPASGRLGGTTATGAAADTLRGFIHRSANQRHRWSGDVSGLWGSAGAAAGQFPACRDRRPADDLAEGRYADARGQLSGDAVRRPAHPARVQQREPEGRARAWRLGDDFETVARRFAPQLRVPLPGVGHLLAMLRVTKTPRSAYDALMLQLHDCMKADDGFQQESPQSRVDLAAGSTWLAFTDQVSHAATSGQYQLNRRSAAG